MLLSLKGLVVHHGKLKAVKGISLEVPEDTITCLLGANGAGKSTVLGAISGLYQPTRGEIWYRDERIDGLSYSAVARKGITQIPEGKALFHDMTVRENLELGAYTRRVSKGEINEDIEEIISKLPMLREKIKSKVSELSGGQQQAVAVARALMAKPSLLLMDEPTQGLAPLIIEEVVEKIITELRQRGVTILLIEHNVHVALGLSEKIYILEQGNVAFAGTAQEFSQDEYVQKIYLGG